MTINSYKPGAPAMGFSPVAGAPGLLADIMTIGATISDSPSRFVALQRRCGAGYNACHE